MNKKLHWSGLTQRQKRQLNGGCGPGKTMFLIPQFVFKASCEQHDFYYRRGGDLFDKAEADLMFFAYMMTDITDLKGKKGLFKRLGYTFLAKTYFILVCIFGAFAFRWGKYRTFEEIVN